VLVAGHSATHAEPRRACLQREHSVAVGPEHTSHAASQGMQMRAGFANVPAGHTGRQVCEPSAARKVYAVSAHVLHCDGSGPVQPLEEQAASHGAQNLPLLM
jgi:hypothetical protein